MEEITIGFIYNSQKTNIQCNKDDIMENIFKKYLAKIGKSPQDIYFLYNGSTINDDIKIKDMSNNDKEIKILVYDDSSCSNDKIEAKYSKEIICPVCKESCLINISNYVIDLNRCDNKHFFNNINFNKFIHTQEIDESKILCNKCKNTKKDSYQNQFYKCCICRIDLCPLCKSNHNKEHIIIDYDLKNYLCKTHGEKYISYCEICNQNLCDLCEYDHNKEHTLIHHKDIEKNSDIKKNLDDLGNKINELKNEIQNIENNLKIVIDSLERYYNQTKSIINNFNIKNKNYQILINMNNINNSYRNIIKDISNILNQNSMTNKVKYIEEIYDKINGNKKEKTVNLERLKNIIDKIKESKEEEKGKCESGKTIFKAGINEEDDLIKCANLSENECSFLFEEYGLPISVKKKLEKILDGKIIVGWKIQSFRDEKGGSWTRNSKVLGTSSYSFTFYNEFGRMCNWKLSIWIIDKVNDIE